MIQGARPIRPRAPVESNRLRINTTGWRSINERPPPARFRYGRALMTEPMWRKGRHLDAVQARILHGMATKLDGLPGEFPPDDTGSSGLGAAKAAKALGTSPPPRLWLGGRPRCPSPSSSASTGSPGATSRTKDGLPRAGRRGELVHLYNSWSPSWGVRAPSA
jgi:hypothetical protein